MKTLSEEQWQEAFNHVFHEKIKIANQMALTMFVFDFCGITYCARWDAPRWMEPVKIEKL